MHTRKRVFAAWIGMVTFLLFLLSCDFSPFDKKTYTIARDPLWYPLMLMGKEAKILGFSDELVAAIAQLESFDFELVSANWDATLFSLENGKYDALLTTHQPQLSDADKFDFSEPYLLTGPVLVVQENSPIRSLEDMSYRVLGVVTNTEGMSVVDKYPGVVVHRYASPAIALDDLANDRIDGVFLGNIIAKTFCYNIYEGKLKVVSSPLDTQGIRLMTLKNKHPSLIQYFDRGLDRLKEKGVYEQLINKWQIY